MNVQQKIINALVAKGYPKETITAEWEPVSYYSSGREGGWDVEVDDQELPNIEWWDERMKGVAVLSDNCNVGPSSFQCYNLRTALEIISYLPNYYN